MTEIEVPVLIVGGGGCGLTSSIFLSDLGVDHLLVERHASTSRLPKAHYLNQRTMELFRQHGLASDVAAQAATVEQFGKVRWQTSLAGQGPLDGRVIFEMDAFGAGTLREIYARDSPVLATNLPQIRLEPILRRHAEERAPGRILFGHELIGWEDQGTSMVATITERASGRQLLVRTRYVIAADGGKTIGPRLGVRMQGLTNMADITTAHFSADLSPWMHDGTLITWFINPQRADLSGAALVEMGPTWGRHSEEWGLHFAFAPDDPARLDEAAVVPRIRELLGLPDLDITLHEVSHWILEAVLADRYRIGNIFLAGDAAHRNPPATGLGLNTAIQDAHNLTWKLAAVLAGHAGEGLLDSYEPERRPVARRNIDWSLSASMHHQVIMDAALGLGAHLPPQMRTPMFFAYFDESPMGETVRARAAEIFRTHRAECQAHDIELGYAYETGALIPDGSPAPERSPMGDVYRPTTRPGHRLPHAWIDRDGQRISTHDLVERGAFVLITGADDDGWRRAAAQVEQKLAVPITVVRIGPDGECGDPEGQWARLREINESGALLLRPDNHVAWRSTGYTESPEEVLFQAFRSILAR